MVQRIFSIGDKNLSVSYTNLAINYQFNSKSTVSIVAPYDTLDSGFIEKVKAATSMKIGAGKKAILINSISNVIVTIKDDNGEINAYISIEGIVAL